MSKPSEKRKRLPAEEARARILEVTRRQLDRVGPQGLRLTEVAAELGISHPAILHHFGSREALVEEVVRQAVCELEQRLGEVLAPPLDAVQSASVEQRRSAVLEELADFYGESGYGRLIAWLALSGHAVHTGEPVLARIAELAQRHLNALGVQADYAETLFRIQLSTVALLGQALLGDALAGMSGQSPDPALGRDFRRRLLAALTR